MKKKKIAITVLSALVLLAVGLIWYFTADYTFETTDLNFYKHTGKEIEKYSDKVMPTLDTLLVYEKIEYQLKSDELHSHYRYIEFLNVTYDSDTYLYAVRDLSKRYHFLNSVITAEGDSGYLIPQYAFKIEDYTFRVVAIRAGDLSQYPKFFGIIATNDAKGSITYMYFYNERLENIPLGDDISETMANFVRKNCDFDFDMQ